ncbi:unnamed protein product [Rhizoctonia solani]|uniref:F-box domain-containing protein n=1 Tax=Rhizoctonia solani TaxID=456999 RepID=A0A8H3DI55_9AGAM|nr:unnamed protein product [Rhizoctonia solani]
MGWATLVPEILILVLGNASISDIRNCRQVCRRFRQLIDSNVYLQYLLYLDTMGYQPPEILRKDLGFAQMLQVLRENRDGWHLYTELGRPSFIHISPTPEKYTAFVDGVFACTQGSSKSDEAYKFTIHFHQLASINKGIGYKYWSHTDVGCNVKYIAIQPELDLLVLLSYKGNYFSPDNIQYQIYLRTMSTNDPHPLAASPIINLEIAQAAQYDLRFQDSLVQIHGRMIGVRFGCYRNPALKPLIMVWNWMLGVEVAHLELECRRQYSMTFISEEYFLVPELPKPIEGTRWNYNQLGRLDVYRIPLDDSIVPLGNCVASFLLPDPAEQQNSVSLQVSMSPSPAPNSGQSHPRIYETALENCQIHIYISTSIDDPTLSSGSSSRLALHGLLYIPTNRLLDCLTRVHHPHSTAAPVPISWGDWGCHASWISHKSWETIKGCHWGQRHAFRFNIKVETPQNRYTSAKRFCVVDHNRKRVKLASLGPTRILGGTQSERQAGGIDVQDNTAPMSKEAAERMTFHEALDWGPQCTETVFRMEGISDILESNGLKELVDAEKYTPLVDLEPLTGGFVSLVMDDEHLVVLVPMTRSTSVIAGLLVYNIGQGAPDTSTIPD